MFSEANSPACNHQKSCFSPTFNGDISEQITKCMMRLSRPAVTGYSLKALGAWCRQVVLYIYKKKQCREFIKHPQYKMNIHLQGHNSAKTQETIFISALPHILSTHKIFSDLFSAVQGFPKSPLHTLTCLSLVLYGWPSCCHSGPRHVTYSLRLSLSNTAAGCRGAGPPWGPVGVSFKSYLPWLPERVFSPL